MISNWGPSYLFTRQHLITFDGVHMDLSVPACTYLLARDLTGSANFSLAVKYAAKGGKPYAAVLMVTKPSSHEKTVKDMGYPSNMKDENWIVGFLLLIFLW